MYTVTLSQKIREIQRGDRGKKEKERKESQYGCFSKNYHMIQKFHYCTYMQRTYGQIDTCSYMFTKELSTTIKKYNPCAIYLFMAKKIWYIHTIQQEKGRNSVMTICIGLEITMLNEKERHRRASIS